MANQNSDYGYVVYIDEAGDSGIKAVRPIDENGSSEWMTLSAVLVHSSRETEVAGWGRDIYNDLGLKQARSLHYNKLSPTRRLVLAQRIAELPLRAFVICSNKKNMRGYRNLKAESVRSQEWFYNWMVRLLLERVTIYCDARMSRHHTERKKIKVEFSQRGGHGYGQTPAYHRYLQGQQQSGQIYLKTREPVTDLLSMDLIENYPHYTRAGLQLADCVASAFYQATDCLGPGQWNLEPAKALKPRMTLEGTNAANFGVTLIPTPPWKGELTLDQRQIFEFYGYDFEQRW